MRAAWYEKQGPAKEVLRVGEMPDPHPACGEVRIRIAVSGINPGDIKKRQNAFGYGMAYARVIPHSDGAGQVDEIGNGGLCAVQLARRAGAHVIGTIRSTSEQATATKAGAHAVVRNDENLVASVRASAPKDIDHVVEVAFGANIEADLELLKMGGSIATYATDNAKPQIPFWPMVFKNIQLFFLGSDDFPKDAKRQAAEDLNAALEAGWSGFEIAERIPLSEIARAHELVEHPSRSGRVVVIV